MTLRTEILTELFARCRAFPDGELATWVEGWPGDTPPLERVWASDFEGPLGYPVSKAASPESPLIVQDEATLTLTAVSQTGGIDRLAAMGNAERYLTVAIRVVAGVPDLGGVVAPSLTLTPRRLRGPYSLPNTAEVGFMAIAELDLELVSRPE